EPSMGRVGSGTASTNISTRRPKVWPSARQSRPSLAEDSAALQSVLQLRRSIGVFWSGRLGRSTPTGRASRHKILENGPLPFCDHPSTSSVVDGKFNQDLITTYLSFTSSGSSGLFSNYGRCSRKQACIQAWLSERREFPTPLCAEATGDAFANGLAIDAERAG